MPSSFDFRCENREFCAAGKRRGRVREDRLQLRETAFHGFAAKLDEDEAERMAEADGVLTVFNMGGDRHKKNL
jgi:hypothetical protein